MSNQVMHKASLNMAEAKEVLEVTSRTLYRMVERGALVKVGKARVSAQSVQEILAKKRK